MKIIPNYFSINNNLNVNNQKQTSFGKNFTIPDDIAKGPGVENITPQFQVKAPIAYSHIEDIKLPNNLTAHYYKLANGQKVIIVPKKGATIVKTYVNTGSLNEPDHLRGISHYIEHNLFNGSEALGDKVFFDEVNKMGASTNASTNFSLTDYYISSQRLEDTDFERQIKLHAGMVQTPKFLQEKLDKEKKIVDSEINMALSDEYSRAATITIKNLFNIKSKAPDLVAGSTDNIDALTRDDVVNYFNNNYFPANMVTVITGETTPEEAPEEAEAEPAPAGDSLPNYVELPITAEPITLTLWTTVNPMLADTINSLDQCALWDVLEERTNIHMDGKLISAMAGQEQFQLMMASGDYTDLLDSPGANYATGIQGAMDDDVLLRHSPQQPFAVMIRQEKRYTAKRGTVKTTAAETERVPLTEAERVDESTVRFHGGVFIWAGIEHPRIPGTLFVLRGG